jgi:hypothetical protein
MDNYPKYLIASTINGVYQVSPIDFTIDYPHLAPLKPKWFYENLKGLEDDEQLSTIIDREDEVWFEKIREEYSIR